MKTYKNLYPQIHSFENLYLAYKSAARGKRGRPDVAAFEMDLEDNLFQLQAELETQTYAPGPYYHFTIHEPKRRRISAAPFRDRVVHHALVRVMEPVFERRAARSRSRPGLCDRPAKYSQAPPSVVGPPGDSTPGVGPIPGGGCDNMTTNQRTNRIRFVSSSDSLSYTGTRTDRKEDNPFHLQPERGI